MENKRNKPYKPESAPHKDGGQRISVRPGNFNPPSNQGGGSTPENKSVQSTGQAHYNKNRRNRNKGRRPHDNRPREELRTQNADQRPVAKQSDAPAAQSDRRQNQTHGQNKGRRGGRTNRPNNDAHKREQAREEVLSPVLQRELDEEFNTSSFYSGLGAQTSKRPFSDEALDSEEFAVDIATASYLTDDVPCGFPIPDGNAVEVVGVRFRGAGRMYFFAPGSMKFNIGDRAIVDTARGPELGDIVMLNRKIAQKDIVQPLRSVLRAATPEDLVHEAENRAKEIEALAVCEKKIATHKLDMRLVDAQFTFDNSKLLFYFTSEGRVDFRELVHDLASHFHTRIELRQIGIRDESRLIGGLGMCGRPFCCSTFLSDFGQVSVKMAKEQGLSINASKISGCCGRLMCCLRYEHETYVAESKLTPKKDTVVITPDGKGTVVDNSPLAGTVRVRLDATPEEAPKVYHRDTLTVCKKDGTPVEQAPQDERTDADHTSDEE